MNILVLLTVFVCCQISIVASQYPLQYVASSHPVSHENINQARNQHENKIKVRYSQDLWQDRKALQYKKNQIAGFAQCVQSNQAVADHYKNLHEQAKNLQIDRYSFDDVFAMGRVNPQALTPLKYAWMSRISIDMQELAQLKSMSQSDQWQYFNEYKETHKNDCPDVYDVSTLIHHLEGKLYDEQEEIATSVHAMRSKSIAAQYFSLYASVHNVVQFYAQYLQSYKQEENNIRNDMVAKFDAQSAKSEPWIRLAHKLSERSLDTLSYQQHKLLQTPINQDIIARGKEKTAARNQAKKLRLDQQKAAQLLIEQEKASQLQIKQQKIIVCVEQEIVQQQKIVASIQQDNLEQGVSAEEDAESIARRKQREKNRLKAQRQKQRKKEAISPVLGEKQDQVEMLKADQNNIDDYAGKKINKTEIYEKFMIDVEHEYKLRNVYARDIYNLPGLTPIEKNRRMQSYDERNEACSCFNLLQMYTELVCEDNITDEKLKRLKELSAITIQIHNGLQSKNHHMAWYLHVDKKLCKKVCDRYKELHVLYHDAQFVSTMQHTDRKYAFDSLQAAEILSEYKESLTQAKIALKKSIQDKESQEMQKEKKIAMETWILEVKNQDDKLKEICLLYKSFEQEVLAAKLYQAMKELHDAGSILDVDRLSSLDLDIASW